MRTDSVSWPLEALTEIREYIAQRYGADQVPEQPRVYKSKSKNAQEAHEAIRPTASAENRSNCNQNYRAIEIIYFDLEKNCGFSND